MARSKGNKSKPTPLPPPPPMDSADDDLMNDLLTQLDSRDQNVQIESAQVLNDMNLNQKADNIEASSSRKDPKSRFKARQARKAAALAQSYSPDDPEVQARLAKEAQDEMDAIKRVCKELSLDIQEINPDGHCFFSAVADQLALLGILPLDQANYANLRIAAANFMQSYPDDFLPFLPSLVGEDGAGALDAGLMSLKEFEDYCTAVRETAIWGGEPEIVAVVRAFNVPIHVVQGGQPPVVIHNPPDYSRESNVYDDSVVRISYHRKLYGLGEHYNSLRKVHKLS
ncbi:hypothetical protein CPB84DRAFT_900813 [Gymnopilus junonius]|uniref:OTU domain-containing protein n=1 Tax=Gymnopilus junonius TaxID=109634 RepID=A0A9P5NQI9_GYMJU|nr:hypothetical protein CPB84DRAFT_900813 [Gymnopilus junonius]